MSSVNRFALSLILAGLAAAQQRTPVVVELFTSEGCSSCPPADELLYSLERSASPNVEVIALGEHVDYWNQLGWQDRFSSPVFSARQQDYGRAFKMQSVYTPELVINGETEFIGSDAGRALREVRKAGILAAKARIEMFLVSPDSMRLKVEEIPAGTQEADILLAITEAELSTTVQAGENSGRQLHHAAVVRSLVTLGRMDCKKAGSYSADIALKLRPEWRRSNLKLVLLVQDRTSRKILGASTLHL